MRLLHFETLKPLCPACRAAGADHPVALEAGAVIADGVVRTGILRCTSPACGKAYPIISGAPVLVPNVSAWFASNLHLVLQSEVESEAVEALIGAAVGPDAAFNIVRQQQSTYGHDHYGDVFAPEAPPVAGSVRGILAHAMAHLPAAEGAALDLGCAVGRTTFDLAAVTGRLALGIDLNWHLLKVGRTLLDERRVHYPLRRSGHVFERRTRAVTMPGEELADFWIADALALPFASNAFGYVAALNVLDCVSEPLRLISEAHRVLREGGGLALATPFDWASHATPPEHWLSGVDATAAAVRAQFFSTSAKDVDAAVQYSRLPWSVRLHDNAVVHYECQILLVSKPLISKTFDH